VGSPSNALPSFTSTLHFPHVPTPPHVAEMSIPNTWAASKRVPPTLTAVCFPSGWK
jgi:hypothetical protein